MSARTVRAKRPGLTFIITCDNAGVDEIKSTCAQP